MGSSYSVTDGSLSLMLVYKDAGGKWLLVSPELVCITFLLSLVLLMMQCLLSLLPQHRDECSDLAPAALILGKGTSLNFPSLNFFNQNEHLMAS